MTTQLPAYLQNLPQRNLTQTALDNTGTATPPYLSIADGRFTLVDATGALQLIEKLSVDVIIVDVNKHVSQTYFDPNKPYDPNEVSPPLCFSDNGVGPSTQAREPQANFCTGCPKQEWGKINALGHKVPWCQRSQKIAIWPFEYSSGLFMLKLPPNTAFGSWKEYLQKFKNAGLELDRVITRITFAGTGTLAFQSPGYTPESLAPTLIEMIESKACDALIGRLDRPREAALVTPSIALPPPPEQTRATLPFAAAPTTVVTSSFVPATVPAAPPTPTAGPVAGSQVPATVVQQPTQRRRRRTQAEIQAAQQAQQPAAPAAAPFRSEPVPQASPANGQFGIDTNPPAPPPGLDLDSIFK